MNSKIENLIKQVYTGWKLKQDNFEDSHPDEETLACFVDGKLPMQESQKVMVHLIHCSNCMQDVTLQAQLDYSQELKAPENLLLEAKGLLAGSSKVPILEIVLRLGNNLLELVNTTGDVLMGQELIPAALFRSRQLKGFKDEIIILKDFEDLQVEIKVENKNGKVFNLMVMAREKQAQIPVEDLRISLIKADTELESYHTDTGKVIFENVLLGKYNIEVSNIDHRLASIIVDIRT